MARHAPNILLAALLAEARWSAGELARAVNALGSANTLELRYDRTSVAHWLSGSRPRAPVPDLVAAALSSRAGRLVTAQDTGLAQPVRPPHLSMYDWSAEVDPVTQMVSLARGDVDPAHRALLARSAYSPVGLDLLGWPQRLATPPSGSHHRAAAADARALHEMTHVFADLAERHGGAHARTALASYLADDAGRMLTAHAPTAVHQDLLTATAQLTHLLAAMTSDTGHPGLAQCYYQTALGLARAGGSRTTYAITLRAMSAQALRLGHHHSALQLADAALQAAGSHASPATLAFLHIQRALVHAHDRQPNAALDDLTTAESQCERASAPLGPFTSYPRAGLDYQRAQTLLVLGHRTEALVALRASAAHRPATQRRSFALTQARLAETLLDIGHLEEACTHWHHFLDHYPHLHSTQTDQALNRLLARLRPHQRQRHAAVLWERARRVARR
ncbi:tol-pal system YbgF family protein [Streptacidiphilus sp. EB103A]|uniref:tetratricopeptide repeat protein n=1 Tax=Streptacidiphilus sp. EB103A TaxID=3156275 RepID=UPI0035131617